ncbi:MAG TPA: hypothetical protein VHA80_08790 [Solirubrobacterales bacterium]|nr:hypothetical protein [Solirubrobacterales bacterium]
MESGGGTQTRGGGPAPGGAGDVWAKRPETSGWALFAGVLLLVVGALDALYGLAAVLNSEVVVVGGDGVMIFSVAAWGWVHLILGALVALSGLGLLYGRDDARMAAIFFIALNAVLQVVWFPLAPLWALLVVLLDVAIIYHLTVRWEG